MTKTLTGLVAIIGLCVLPSCSKDKDKNAPAPAPAAPAAPAKPAPSAEPPAAPTPAAAGACPTATTVTALDSSKDISKEGPFDLATFTFAKARLSADGAKLEVFVSNKDWPLERLSGLKSPIENNGEAYLALTFKAKDPAALVGTYQAKNRDQPGDREVTTSLFVNQHALGVSLGDSTAAIIQHADGTVCGTFDLNGEHEFDGKKTHFAGTFLAPL